MQNLGRTVVLIDKLLWFLTYNPSVLMCVEITDAPNSSGNVQKHGICYSFRSMAARVKYPGFV